MNNIIKILKKIKRNKIEIKDKYFPVEKYSYNLLNNENLKAEYIKETTLKKMCVDAFHDHIKELNRTKFKVNHPDTINLRFGGNKEYIEYRIKILKGLMKERGMSYEDYEDTKNEEE